MQGGPRRPACWAGQYGRTRQRIIDSIGRARRRTSHAYVQRTLSRTHRGAKSMHPSTFHLASRGAAPVAVTHGGTQVQGKRQRWGEKTDASRGRPCCAHKNMQQGAAGPGAGGMLGIPANPPHQATPPEQWRACTRAPGTWMELSACACPVFFF
jgi:hypothetical protein